MGGYRDSTSEELERSRDARSARQLLDRLEKSVSHLEQAIRLRTEAGKPVDPELNALLGKTRDECMKARLQCYGQIEPRRRPKTRETKSGCTIFLDECGQHALAAHDEFPVFVLAAVIVRDVDLPVVDAEWKRWKVENLGADAIVHEPDVRRLRPPFYGPGAAAVEKLPEILSRLDYAALAVVVHRADHVEEFGTGQIDVSLPAHAYLVALDFMMERVVFALERHFDGAKARVVAESRGPKEDALLQFEFARLHLDGTTYISSSWFRQQLHSGIDFRPKIANDTGLQLADLLARPVGEKVADPSSDPDRWSVFREKLCQGQETKNSIIGLKVIPWRERYEGLWKS